MLSSKGGGKVGIKMEYYAGPWTSGGVSKGGSTGGAKGTPSAGLSGADVSSNRAHQSQSCVIL